MKRSALVLGAAFGFVGVALGAFGAHGLEDLLKANGREGTWDTAVLYLFVHSGLLLVIGLLAKAQKEGKRLSIATVLCVLGILIFSGSLFALSITNIKWLGAITPIGGLSFLGAWAMVFMDSLYNRNKI
jgi:uncharacterized membrane protein YgdD (TMEM256/DUF423 family)